MFACPDCGKGLDVAYDYELAARHFKDIPGEERPQNIWHFEELLPIVDAAAQARVGRALRLHPADPRRAPRRRARHCQPVPQGRLHLAPEPLLQGPRRVDVRRAPARARQDRDRLRVHRQRGHGRGLARGHGRGRRLRLLPQPPRGHEGAGVHGPRREGLPGRGQLRRSQPPLPRARRSDGHGLRQHHAAPVLCRGRQDGRLRDRRAARLACARAHRHRRGRRHAVLAPAQGPRRAAAARPRRDRRHAHPHRPAERLQPDRRRDPRRGGRGPRGHARDRRPLARDRRTRATATS